MSFILVKFICKLVLGLTALILLQKIFCHKSIKECITISNALMVLSGSVSAMMNTNILIAIVVIAICGAIGLIIDEKILI